MKTGSDYMDNATATTDLMENCDVPSAVMDELDLQSASVSAEGANADFPSVCSKWAGLVKRYRKHHRGLIFIMEKLTDMNESLRQNRQSMNEQFQSMNDNLQKTKKTPLPKIRSFL